MFGLLFQLPRAFFQKTSAFFFKVRAPLLRSLPLSQRPDLEVELIFCEPQVVDGLLGGVYFVFEDVYKILFSETKTELENIERKSSYSNLLTQPVVTLKASRHLQSTASQ